MHYCFLISVFSLRSSPINDILCLWHWVYIYTWVNYIQFGDSIYYYRIGNIFWFFNIININGCCYFTIWDIKLRNSFGFFVSYRTHEQKQRCDIEKETLLIMLQIVVFLSFITLHRSHRFSWFVDDLLTQYYVLFSSLSCKNNS